MYNKLGEVISYRMDRQCSIPSKDSNFLPPHQD